jgi:hypothetical protein
MEPSIMTKRTVLSWAGASLTAGILAAGAVRYGTEAAGMTVTVRNPCPPGDIEHEMMAMRSLPGRGRK